MERKMNDDDTLEWMKKLAGLKESVMEEGDSDPIAVAGNIKQYAEDLYAMLQGGRGNPQQMIQQIENGLNIIKQSYAGKQQGMTR
jgi:hypothetical protein